MDQMARKFDCICIMFFFICFNDNKSQLIVNSIIIVIFELQNIFTDSSIECFNFIPRFIALKTFKDLIFLDCFSIIYHDITVYSHNTIVIGFDFAIKTPFAKKSISLIWEVPYF